VISVHNKPPSHSCVCVLTDRISPLIWYPAFGTEKDAGKYIRGQDADSLPWKPAARGGDFFVGGESGIRLPILPDVLPLFLVQFLVHDNVVPHTSRGKSVKRDIMVYSVVIYINQYSCENSQM
jgi:hypothetical protein